MALPSYMLGLLANDESLAPNLGLLGGGVDPVKAMLGSLAAQQPRVVPGPPSPPPAVRAAQTAPPVAPVPAAPPPSLSRGPGGILENPTQMGFLAGGIAALEANPGSAFTGPGPVIAAALKAGLPAYIATKQNQADRALAADQDAAYGRLLSDPAFVARLRPEQVRLLKGMSARQGLKLAEDLVKQEPAKLDPNSPEVLRNKADLEKEVNEARPRNLDPLSDEGMKRTEEMLRLKASLEHHNRDPWGPEAIAARERLARLEASLRPPPGADARPVPASIVQAIRGSDATITAIEKVLGELKANPDATGWLHKIPGATFLLNQLQDPESVLTRGDVAGAGLLAIYDRTGKQVNKIELEKAGDIPRAEDRGVVAAGKLERLLQRAKDTQTFLRESYAPEYGWRMIAPPSGNTSAPTAGPDSKAALRKWYEDNKQPVPDWLK